MPNSRLYLLPVFILCVPVLSSAETPDFNSAREVLRAAIKDKAFPGCAVAVGTSETLLWTQGFGHFVYDTQVARQLGMPSNPEVTPDSIYDLASLTKVIATTSVIMALVRDGRLNLDERVSKLVPEFSGSDSDASQSPDDDKSAVTVEHLLVHASGLPAWKPFYKQQKGYERVLDAVSTTALENLPGTAYRYSDLGFMLLGDIAARSGGKQLDQLEQQLVFKPLGMKNTFRCPPENRLPDIVPTERDPAGKGFMHGTVHDENCRAAGGITGHAGLFSNARDLSRFAAEMLKACRGDSDLFPKKLVQQFVSRRELISGSSRALGWDTPSGQSSGGQNISPSAFGHTGFTGTSIWIDPQRDLYFILLTNRVHPTRENKKLFAVRRQFGDAVTSAFDAR